MPTLLDIFGAPLPRRDDGAEPRAAAARADDAARAARGCIFGQFGAAINFTDGRYVYFLYPREPFEREPLPVHADADAHAHVLRGGRVHERATVADAPVHARLSAVAAAGAEAMQRRTWCAAIRCSKRGPRCSTWRSIRTSARRCPRRAEEARIRRAIAALLRENEAPAEVFARYGLVEQVAHA